jgi:hypothetical protein
MLNNSLLKKYIKFYFNVDVKLLSVVVNNSINLELEFTMNNNFTSYFKLIEQYNILTSFNIIRNTIKFNVSLPKDKYIKLII